jgi:hypothetical protein
MRNLDECRAEVFRRSEARIKARKRRRNAILTACVPVALCVALLWLVKQPGVANETTGAVAECVTEPAMGAMGVDGERIPLAPQNYDTVLGNAETDFPGVEIRILGFDPADGGTLTVVWENKTEYEVTYGEAYTIQRQGEDCWINCQRQPGLAFTAIGYLLMPGQTRTEQYSLRYTYDVSAPGTYRFESTCFVQNTPNESAKCTLSAEFTTQ